MAQRRTHRLGACEVDARVWREGTALVGVVVVRIGDELVELDPIEGIKVARSLRALSRWARRRAQAPAPAADHQCWPPRPLAKGAPHDA